MSPRPRKVDDSDVFAAAYRAMQRVGPQQLTLGEIAREAGLTPGALVQRFGSKRRLQVALAESAAASAGDMIRALRAKHDSPLEAIRAYAACMADLADSPEALARNLAYLTQDLSDPDLRENLLVQSRATRVALEELVREAIERRELGARTEPARLARVLESIIGGSLFSWAVYREGSAKRFLRDQVDAVLGPYRRPTTRRAT